MIKGALNKPILLQLKLFQKLYKMELAEKLQAFKNIFFKLKEATLRLEYTITNNVN